MTMGEKNPPLASTEGKRPGSTVLVRGPIAPVLYGLQNVGNMSIEAS